MSNDHSPAPRMPRWCWPAMLGMLVVGVGIGVALDRWVLPRAPISEKYASSELEIFEQKGPFDGSGGQGETNFPIPYAFPPNVKFDYTGRIIAVVEVKTTGFKWKDVGAGSHAATGTWTAKGIKATKVQ